MGITDKIIASNNVEKKLYPSFEGRTLNIEISGRCNEKCIYCQYYAKGVHKSLGMIDEELFYRVTKEARELGITDVGLYMVGEPLLNPNIYKYVDYLKHEIGFEYVYISTNGILLTPDNLEKLVAAGIDSIKFSVSGASRETFFKHHGVDVFDKVYENIKYAYEYRQKNNFAYKLYMFCILTRYNEMEEDLIRETYESYVDELVVSPVLASQCVHGVKELLSVRKTNEVIDQVRASIPCNMLFNRISIDVKGRLVACCYDLTNDLSVIADLSKVSLKDAVYGEDFVRLRQRHLSGKVSNTICDFCVNGNKDDIYPLANNIKMDNVCISDVDISDEIKERFCI